jgi:V-type H+-transporting ATPase subunit a
MDQYEREVRQMSANLSLLTRNSNELNELMYVLTKDAAFFKEALPSTAVAQAEATKDAYIPLLSKEEHRSALKASVKISFITGVIVKEKYTVFERVLWRSLRGNLYLRNEAIEEKVADPSTGEKVEKVVFIIFFQGEQSQHRITRICDSFAARVYDCPEAELERMRALEQVAERITEMAQVLTSSHEAYRQRLVTISNNLERNTVAVRKYKAAYSVLNLCDCDRGRRCFIAEGWCPENAIDDVLNALSLAQHRSGTSLPSVLSLVETKENPPTSFPTTEATGQFQMIVDAYGVARYGEVNPGVLTMVTFPFLFAIMFGDFGHGLILLLASGAMIYFEKKLKTMRDLNDIFIMLFEGRYLIFLMALFSLFTGVVYNDFFSFPIDLFGSRYALAPGGK